MKQLFFLFGLLISFSAFSQEGKVEYVVNLDSLYAARDLVAEAIDLIDERDFERAILLCEDAIRKAVTLRDAYITRHLAYERNRSSPELMIANLRAAQKISLDDEELYYYLGNVYQNLKKLDEAVENYSLAIDNSKDDAEVSPIRYSYFFNRATSYLKQRKYAESIPDFTATLERFPDHMGSNVNRGFAYFNTKDKENACKDWKKAEALGSKQVAKFIAQYCN